MAGAKNEGLALRMINASTMLLRCRSLSLPDRWKRGLAELSDILDALRRSDPDDAHRFATEHVRTAAQAALSFGEPGSTGG